MAPTLRVRDALEADLPAIHEIYGHHVLTGLGSFEESPPSLKEMTSRYLALSERGMPYLVAENETDQVVGYAYAGPYRPRPAYRFALEDSVYVAPGQEDQGVGAALLSALIPRGEALGYRQMVAMIGDSGNLGSIRLHEKLGFERAGVVKSVGFKLGRWVDVVILQRPLGEGDGTLPIEDS